MRTTPNPPGLLRTSAGWEFYDSRANAEARVESARKEAVERAREGYDFGYCLPGQIVETVGGEWRVTIP